MKSTLWRLRSFSPTAYCSWHDSLGKENVGHECILKPLKENTWGYVTYRGYVKNTNFLFVFPCKTKSIFETSQQTTPRKGVNKVFSDKNLQLHIITIFAGLLLEPDFLSRANSTLQWCWILSFKPWSFSQKLNHC